MTRELVVSRLIITLDNKGNFESGVALYRVKVDGILGKDQQSIGIKNAAFSKLHMAGIIDNIIDGIKKQEKIDG
ncbi:MAG: hypothetical protein WC484_07085 [Candidatus Omnitrophota bacterium]|jgi:hypothetical protein